jgi:hypothetical protein
MVKLSTNPEYENTPDPILSGDATASVVSSDVPPPVDIVNLELLGVIRRGGNI